MRAITPPKPSDAEWEEISTKGVVHSRLFRDVVAADAAFFEQRRHTPRRLGLRPASVVQFVLQALGELWL
jgi:hypothetical protein